MTPFFIDFKSVWPLIFTKPYIWLGPSFVCVLNPRTEKLMKYPRGIKYKMVYMAKDDLC